MCENTGTSEKAKPSNGFHSPSDPETKIGNSKKTALNISAEDGLGYHFYGRYSKALQRKRADSALHHGNQILNPKISDPSYLVLKKRKEILSKWISELPTERLDVLDIGGRIQPYRSLLNDRVRLYIGTDPVFEGLVNVVGLGEKLPFADECFDLVICTQMLNYAVDPFSVVGEIHRVLKPNGCIFLSVPAIFPRYHDQRWRFMPEGIGTLLLKYSEIQIVPEGFSVTGFLRTLNLFIDTFFTNKIARIFSKRLIYPVVNFTGLYLDRISKKKTKFSCNYCCRAFK